jgi:hypothetical protein
MRVPPKYCHDCRLKMILRDQATEGDFVEVDGRDDRGVCDGLGCLGPASFRYLAAPSAA